MQLYIYIRIQYYLSVTVLLNDISTGTKLISDVFRWSNIHFKHFVMLLYYIYITMYIHIYIYILYVKTYIHIIYLYTRMPSERYASHGCPMVFFPFGTLGPGDKSFRIRFKRWSSDRTVARRVAMAGDHGTAQPSGGRSLNGSGWVLGIFGVPKRRIVGVNAEHMESDYRYGMIRMENMMHTWTSILPAKWHFTKKPIAKRAIPNPFCWWVSCFNFESTVNMCKY